MKVFIFDSEKCNGCHNCQIACKDEHVGNEWLPYAKQQPNTGQFWLSVKQKEHGQTPMVKVEYRAQLCMHCEVCDPSEVCAPDAFIRRDDGLIYIDPLKCNGCEECVSACPYEAVFFDKEAKIAQKCTGCAHLLDKGEVPHCVDLCPSGALQFGEEGDFSDVIGEAEILKPELEKNPKVFYVNLPHLFLGGEVWDPAENEIIEGASVKLTSPGGRVIELRSDDFGDFKFERLDEGTYDLAIDAQGYVPVERKAILLDESLYLGDFPLEKN